MPFPYVIAPINRSLLLSLTEPFAIYPIAIEENEVTMAASVKKRITNPLNVIN
jgi:hypothetical protein